MTRLHPSKRFLKPAVLLTGTAAVVLAGSMAAYAGWSVPSPGGTTTVRAAKMPGGQQAVAVDSGYDVKVSWPRVTIVPGVEVSAYEVIRSGAQGAGRTVCETSKRTCTDTNVPNGTYTYAVRPRQGKRWIGAAGPASAVVEIKRGRKGAEAAAVTRQAAPTATTTPGAGSPLPSPAATNETAGPSPTTAPQQTSSPPADSSTAEPTASPTSATDAP